jgi:hypothetical protein
MKDINDNISCRDNQEHRLPVGYQNPSDASAGLEHFFEGLCEQ